MRSELDEKVKSGMEVGGYRIDRKLGQGGFGGVYLAWRDGRPSALKFIHLESVGDWGWRELFVMLPQQSAHVVKLRGHLRWPEEQPEYLVLVMEYVPGMTLYGWAREHNPCAREVVEKLLPLVRSLRGLHAQGVFHRDLKGDNVLVRETDGAPVLVDFGAGSSPLVPRVTKGVLPPASLYYRSPESLAFSRLEGRVPGARYRYAETDEVYALGVLLYVLLTDVYPFTGPDAALVEGILAGAPTPPHERNFRVPKTLSHLCMRMLAREPGERVPGMEALCEELAVLLQEAREAPGWERPLCFDWMEEERTTEDFLPEGGEIDPEAWLAKWKDKKPRRGRRPMAVPARSHRERRVLPALVALGALGLGVVAVMYPWAREGELEAPPAWEVAWTDQDGMAVAGPGAPPALSPNQKRAPCTAGLELEINGGCWLSIVHTTPACPPQTVAYEGRCLVRVAKPQPVPMSVDAGGPSSPP
ncbi:serine/threonine protein kinase [Melittangium boletus]|uniref:Protein kinase n=1 Tax=Melittangium boletus DSM 14713 TaxID=1294270 RepID=A0A250I7Y8_9BACT|nr:serine/threonine-protein kinase [Melittangium boletus]ATB27308.1 protein kinase [Melittangium boletus DSM 14713]